MTALDRGFLAELLDGDRQFAGELFLAFEEASAQWLNLASDACDSGEKETATRAFHTLKGSASSVGLTAVREHSLRLEHLAKAGDLRGCAMQLPRLQAVVSEGRMLLRDFLAGLPQ